MIKNKWKLAFWISFVLLLLVSGFGLYSIIDQGVTITYMKEGYTSTENDLNTLIQIVNSNKTSKKEIKDELTGHKFYDSMDFKRDTISLERVELIFNNDTLQQIIKQW
jgi:hypothetical protein